jgi:predicted enzyme related to lactoylglutathione lyase
MAYLHGKFVWFEHVSNDVSAARAYYGEVFGWGSEGVPMGGATYYMIQIGADGIGGFRAAAPGVPNHWISYLSVADVDGAAKAAAAAGANMLMPPTDFPSVGRGAALADPTGAAFSIWKGAQGDRPDAAKVPVGDWYWNECMTTDAEKALAFYERAFGFTHETMNVGQGPYYVLKKDGVARGGVMKSPDPAAPPGWLPYVCVADCDATARRAQALGGRVLVQPTDIPEVGRFTVIADPQGATIGAIRGAQNA